MLVSTGFWAILNKRLLHSHRKYVAIRLEFCVSPQDYIKNKLHTFAGDL